MSQQLANKLQIEFTNLTGIQCKAVFMGKGVTHRPSTLNDTEKGVYVFFDNDVFFKVGKAGSKSPARWNSHHYNLDQSTPSTLTKSIKKDIVRFKSFFPLINMRKLIRLMLIISETGFKIIFQEWNLKFLQPTQIMLLIYWKHYYNSI